MNTPPARTLARLESLSKSPLRVPVLQLVILGILAALCFVAAIQNPALVADLGGLF